MFEHPAFPLTCAQALALLDDFIDRELSHEEMQRVQAHVERCAACATEDRLERAWIDNVRAQLRGVDLPPGVMPRIVHRMGSAAREPAPPDSH